MVKYSTSRGLIVFSGYIMIVFVLHLSVHIALTIYPLCTPQAARSTRVTPVAEHAKLCLYHAWPIVVTFLQTLPVDRQACNFLVPKKPRLWTFTGL